MIKSFFHGVHASSKPFKPNLLTMTKRDFFRVIIKVFGLYALIYMPSNVSLINS